MQKQLEEYVPLVRGIAAHMKARLPANVERDDLVQVGMMGLMQALDRHEEMPNAKFETYATFRIKGAMLDELRRMDWVPRRAKLKAGEIIQSMVSFEDLLPEEGDFLEILASDHVTPLDKLIEKERVFAAVAAIAELPEREKNVIDMYYAQDMTQWDIGYELGVSESRACQLLKEVHAHLNEIYISLNG